MRQEELLAIQKKFEQGVEKLKLLKRCLATVTKGMGISINSESEDMAGGELRFWFAGMDFYVRIRITDRDVDDVGPEYRVAVGWLDWGCIDTDGTLDAPMLTDFYDERGILCELEREEFYCNFTDRDDQRVHESIRLKLGKLVGRSIAVNNAK